MSLFSQATATAAFMTFCATIIAMTYTYHVRFAPTSKHVNLLRLASSGRDTKQLDHSNKRRKSKSGCLSCKNLRVKCDETFPVCSRCLKRGELCRAVAPIARWQVESPWPDVVSNHADQRLLRYWLEKACQIMVIDPEINPLSFPILKYLKSSQSLLHSLQSISIAHENFFSSSTHTQFLQERHHALSLFQEELQEEEHAPEASFLTAFTLGMSTAWIDQRDKDDFGLPHLQGARVIIEELMAAPGSLADSFVHLALGCYIYWDQVTAFLPPSLEQPSLKVEGISDFLDAMRNEYHPVIGCSVEMFYLLADIGRYCRAILDYSLRDLVVEARLLETLSGFEDTKDNRCLYLLSDCFKKHGFMMLYSSIEWAHSNTSADLDDCASKDMTEMSLTTSYSGLLGGYAETILQNMLEIPSSSSYHNILALPLLSAGAELSAENDHLRNEVRKRFRALYSLNRIPNNLVAIELLEELWILRDNGSKISWLALMLQKNWKLVFG